MSGRKKASKQQAGNQKMCQDSKMTSASQIKRQWQHQAKMSRARNVKDQDFQEITQSTAVPARRSGAIPIGSPFSLQKGTPWECTFLFLFKTAITLKLLLQIKLCSCPLGSMYCLKKCPDTISAEYAR